MLNHSLKADKIHTKAQKTFQDSRPELSLVFHQLGMGRICQNPVKISKKFPRNWDQSKSSSCFITIRARPKSWERRFRWSFPENPVGYSTNSLNSQFTGEGGKNSLHLSQLFQPFLQELGAPAYKRSGNSSGMGPGFPRLTGNLFCSLPDTTTWEFQPGSSIFVG